MREKRVAPTRFGIHRSDGIRSRSLLRIQGPRTASMTLHPKSAFFSAAHAKTEVRIRDRWPLFLMALLILFFIMGSSSVRSAPIATMPVSKIKPGMKGYALTVFFGTEPDRFDIEVIDIIPDYRTNMDAIVFRSNDPRLVHSGVVAGMSGSPIFIDNKLVGALAYGYPYNKDPIGAITPIHSMLEIDRLPHRPEALPRPVAMGRKGMDAWADVVLGLGTDATTMANLGDPLHETSAGLQPIGAPLSLSGFGPRSTRFLAQSLGLEPSRSGSGVHASSLAQPSTKRSSKNKQGGQRAKKQKKWRPGDSVSVVLISGDHAAGSNGTITWVGGRQGERLLAFGHPMNAIGPTQLPIADAHVHTIIPSFRRSVKIASPLSIQGSMIQDRQPAIALRTDIQAPMIPVRTTIRAADPVFKSRDYHSNVAEHQAMTPNLIAALLMDGIEEASSDMTEVVVATHHKIALRTAKGPRTVEFSEETFFRTGSDRRVLGTNRALALLSIILDNDYEIGKIHSVEQSATVSYGAPVEHIERVRLATEELHAGDLAQLTIDLSSPRGDIRREMIELRIPSDIEDDEIIIEVSGGDWVRPYRSMPDSLDDLIDTIVQTFPSRSIVVTAYRSEEGLSTHHGLLRTLPNSVLETLSPSGSTAESVRFKRASRRVISMRKIIEGTHQLKLTVLPPRTAT